MGKVCAFISAITLLTATTGVALACEPIGWVLVSDKQISVSERACVYEKSGVRVQRIVSGFCPFSPC